MELLFDIIIDIFCLLALFFFLIAPRFSKRKKCKELRVPYAHRGLHDISVGIPENSISGFERAVENGFGIELDVQLSKDKVIMVFHDATLSRMCTVDGRLSDYNASELSVMSLKGTDCKIPTFDEVLAVVGGKVPLLIELKGENNNTELCDYVCSRLDSYKGAFCIESFNPLYIKRVKKLRPDFIRGQLVTNLIRDKWKGKKALSIAMSYLMMNVLSRPDFIAFNYKYRYNVAILFSRLIMRTPCYTWTVKDETDYKFYIKKGISPIFEGFIPKGKE